LEPAINHPKILASAPQNIQTEHTRVLNSRGAVCSIAQIFPPQQQNLLECGSGELAGGVTASEELFEVIESLYYGGVTASKIMAIAQNAKMRDQGRRMVAASLLKSSRRDLRRQRS
jgi:hypothetical protein